jgi:GxxExxY protein
MNENEISYRIIGVALELHKMYGPGMLESAWENALAYDLKELGHEVQQQVGLPFRHKEMKLDVGYRIDIVVDKKVIIEVKNIEDITEIHKAQILTYLKLSGYKLGLLINFNTIILKDGIHRFVNNL